MIIPAIIFYLLKNSEKNEGLLVPVGTKSLGPVSFGCGLKSVASAFLCMSAFKADEFTCGSRTFGSDK